MKDKKTRLALWGVGAGLALAAGLTAVIFWSRILPQSRQIAPPPAVAHTMSSDIDVLNGQASVLDPKDYVAVEDVCTACHTPQMILHSRTWSSWLGIFDQMSGYGAEATPEQWNHIYKYFQHTLTLIDVNDADEDELSGVLGVDEKTAIAIVRRRSDRKFDSAADLESVPGVDKAAIERVKPRLLFVPLSEDQ